WRSAARGSSPRPGSPRGSRCAARGGGRAGRSPGPRRAWRGAARAPGRSSSRRAAPRRGARPAAGAPWSAAPLGRPPLAHAQLLHRARARTRHLDVHTSGLHAVPRLRYAAEPLEDEAAARLVVALRPVPAKALVHLGHRRARVHHEDARGDAPHVLLPRIIVVLDLA